MTPFASQRVCLEPVAALSALETGNEKLETMQMATTAEVPPAVRARYEAVIGLEVHVQLLTASKIFCSCSTRFAKACGYRLCPQRSTCSP